MGGWVGALVGAWVGGCCHGLSKHLCVRLQDIVAWFKDVWADGLGFWVEGLASSETARGRQ